MNSSDEGRFVTLDAAGTIYHLKKTLMADFGFFEKTFMYRAGQEGAKEAFSGTGKELLQKEPRAVLEAFLQKFVDRGYGTLIIESFDAGRRLISLTSSNMAEAWSFVKNADLQRDPICSYTSGLLSYVCQVAFHNRLGGDIVFRAHETDCIAEGKKECKFVIGPAEEIIRLFPDIDAPKETMSERELKLNEEILLKNLELQNLNLELERQVRKKTEDLWRSQESYESLMKLSPDPIATITLSGKISSLNSAGIEMLGLGQESTQEPDMSSVLAGGMREWEKIVWTIEKEGKVDGLESDLVRLDNRRLKGRIYARFADLPGGKYVEALFKDVTDEKAMEEEVKEARSESEFLNDLLSHDIINYTISALHFLQSALKTPDLTHDAKGKLEVATRDIQNAFDLASSVRDLAMAKAEGEEPPELVKDIQVLVAEAIEDSKAMYFDRKLRLNFQKSAEPKYVAAGAIASRLFTNILTNAIKYDQHEEVVIDVTIDNVSESGKTYWRVKISDNGVGIPDEDKQRVFERFERSSTLVRGTGLGLFVAWMIAKAYNGRIWAENRVAGDHTKGTTMIVLLPKAEEKRVAQLRTKPSRISPRAS